MAYPQVTVDGTAYDVFVSLSDMILYAARLTTPAAAAFRALSATPNEQSRFVLNAQTYLDRKLWQGTKTVANQTLSWPRVGVVDDKDLPVDSTTVPARMVSAECELAILLCGDATIYAALNSGSNLKNVKAGPVDVEFFRPITAFNGATVLPPILMDLVGVFLDGGEQMRGGIVSNADSDGIPVESQFEDSDQYRRSYPW